MKLKKRRLTMLLNGQNIKFGKKEGLRRRGKDSSFTIVEEKANNGIICPICR